MSPVDKITEKNPHVVTQHSITVCSTGGENGWLRSHVPSPGKKVKQCSQTGTWPLHQQPAWSCWDLCQEKLIWLWVRPERLNKRWFWCSCAHSEAESLLYGLARLLSLLDFLNGMWKSPSHGFIQIPFLFLRSLEELKYKMMTWPEGLNRGMKQLKTPPGEHQTCFLNGWIIKGEGESHKTSACLIRSCNVCSLILINWKEKQFMKRMEKYPLLTSNRKSLLSQGNEIWMTDQRCVLQKKTHLYYINICSLKHGDFIPCRALLRNASENLEL